MKTLSTILALVISSTLFAVAPTNAIDVIKSKQKNLFVFKVDKELLGGEVVVYHSSGDVVTTMTMTHRKMIIDFCDVKFGVYTITVVKNGEEIESFTYQKELLRSQRIR